MLINIFLMIIIILLIIYIAYLQKLHYDEIKGLYSKIGIEIKTKDEDIKPSSIKNHIKRKIKEQQGGE